MHGRPIGMLRRPLPEPISFLLQKHSTSKSIRECKQIHAKLIAFSQPTSETYLTNTILNFYSRCGDLCHARLLFDHTPHMNVVTWTSMISAYAHRGQFMNALQLFEEMLESGERPNQYTLSIAIRSCTSLRLLELSLQIHGLVIRYGLERDEFAGSSLVDMYFKVGGDLDSARRVFGGLFRRDPVTWNVMISGFSQAGLISEVLGLLREMRMVDELKPNDFTITSLLKCCCLLREVEQVHGLVLKFGIEVDVVVGGALVDLYGKCGSMDSGQKVLDSMVCRDSFVWSSIISGYARNGSEEEAVLLFRDMCRHGLKPDQHSLSSTLKACCEIGDIETGLQIHTQMIKNGYQSDCFVASGLIILYSDFNEICDAEKLFSRIINKDIVTWNSMILGHAQMEGSAPSCIRMFRELSQTTLLEHDGATLIAVLKSCRGISDLVTGIQIHGMISKSSYSCETQVANAVIHMYSKCGAVDDAYKAFNDLLYKDEISWSSVIGNYQQNGFELEALRLCKEMLADGIHLTNFSLPSCIAACSGLAAIDAGKQFHSFVIKFGLNKDIYVGSSIIDMYAKCGNLGESKKAFDEQEEPNEVTLNALISGFAQHGKAPEAIEVFKEMEKKSLVPNEITFLAVLSACSHVGLLEESLWFFNLMHRKYNFKPGSQHYSCLVDVFGRAGRLEEAYQIIQNVKSVSAWRTLLSACRNHGNVIIAEKSARKVMELDPNDHASYVLLSNLYSEEGKWKEALDLRRAMLQIGVKKDPGSSWLIFRDKVHEFCVGDSGGHKMEYIFKEVNVLNQHINNIGSWHTYVDC
ncbi:pentatricopeptide repeat-containing protein At2g33680-like [Malania oleifera]|uniref:pentatricopeptide repeat-containing protein At2g33680-like n=1 Tax=Malania oleifera TaxID=397392 RepID=UPI0025ADB51F|nr:pentatricopeptide repeat-containing protein At2g33680-like [Malania oleifera]